MAFNSVSLVNNSGASFNLEFGILGSLQLTINSVVANKIILNTITSLSEIHEVKTKHTYN